MVQRRIARVLWRYAGATLGDVGFSVGLRYLYSDPEEQLDTLYLRVTRLARYLRQDIDKLWGMPTEEFGRYEKAMSVVIGEENGASGDTAASPIPGGDWGFGDRDGGG